MNTGYYLGHLIMNLDKGIDYVIYNSKGEEIDLASAEKDTLLYAALLKSTVTDWTYNELLSRYEIRIKELEK